MKTNRRDFLKLGLGGAFAALLGRLGLAKAEKSEHPLVDGQMHHYAQSWDEDGKIAVYVDGDRRFDVPPLVSINIDPDSAIEELPLSNLYSQNGQLTFERVSEARKELESRAMAAAGEGDVVFVYPDGGNDQTGDGTQESPYATIAHALSGDREPEQIFVLPSPAEEFEPRAMADAEEDVFYVDGKKLTQVYPWYGPMTEQPFSQLSVGYPASQAPEFSLSYWDGKQWKTL